uniref:Uncharacterized protein n=1 Tax=Rhizophagus irregularis (strain DAOM 181602 / DAOM 197198 / MUCL 43194) TaxID=747089 RepID=U9U237_RHIID
MYTLPKCTCIASSEVHTLMKSCNKSVVIAFSQRQTRPACLSNNRIIKENHFQTHYIRTNTECANGDNKSERIA